MSENEKTPVLALYDCRSKQDYIYRTRKIKEISGGSELLRTINKTFIEEARKKGVLIKKDWRDHKEFSLSEFKADASINGEVVYSGGGNLMIIYKSEEDYKNANKIFSRVMLDNTYTVSMIAAHTEVTDDFNADREKLYAENALKKNTDPVCSPRNVLPFTQTDPTTYMPIVKKTDDKGRPVSLTRESVRKLAAFDNEAESRGGSEKYLDDIVYDRGRESLLAVIYIDGNNMGAKLKNNLNGFRSYDECIPKLREFSCDTDRDFVEAPIEAIEAKLKEIRDNNAVGNRGKYRRVIAGGDEITIICCARDAADIVKTYFETLDQEHSGENGDEKNYACAGIAIFHSHAPFADVYEIAEQCCESGKKKSRAKDSKINYIDFHFCRAGITNDLDVIRQRQDGKLTLLPYSFEDFKKFMEFGKSLWEMGRSNVKDLASAILAGDGDYMFELERVKSRLKKDSELKKTLDAHDEKQKKMIFDAAQVYDLWFADETEVSE